MSGSHLHLSENPLSFDAKGFVVFFDAAHNMLVLLKHNVYYTLDILQPNARLSRPINFIDGGNVLDVKFSLDKRFLAIQRSSLEVEVVDLETTEQWPVRVRQKQGNQLLRGGIIWTDHSDKPKSSQDLVLVTSLGLEFFKVSASKKTCKHARNVNNKIVCFWYEPAERVVLLAIGSPASHRMEVDIRPYQLLPPAPVKLPRMQLPGPISQSDLGMVRLYGALFCYHVDQKQAQLTLHRITREAGGQHRLALQLYIPGSFELSSVDNLLCCHSRESCISMVYDVQSPVRDPFVNPQPVSASSAGEEDGPSPTFCWKGQVEAMAGVYKARDETRRQQKLAEQVAAASSNGTATDSADAKAEPPSAPYAQAWRLLPPDWVLDTSSSSGKGRLWRLCVSLPDVVTDSSNLETLLSFLLRRGQPRPVAATSSSTSASGNSAAMAYTTQIGLTAKEVVLRLLLTLLTEQTPLSILSAVFDTLNEGYLKALVERAYHGQARAGTTVHQLSGGNSQHEGGGDVGVGHSDNNGSDGVRVGLEPAPEVGTALLCHFVNSGGSKVHGSKNEGGNGEDEAGDATQQSAAPPSDPTNAVKPKLLFAPPVDPQPAQLAEAQLLHVIRNSRGHLVVLQIEMFAHVLIPAAADPRVDRNFLVAVLSEYLRSLQRNYIPAQQYLHELLTELLSADGRLGELYQLLQYRVTADSIQLATRLLMLGHNYEPLCQLALDMLFRMDALEHLTLGLLSTNKLIPAMRLVLQQRDRLTPRNLPAKHFMQKCCEISRIGKDGSGAVANPVYLFFALHQFLNTWDPKLVTRIASAGSNADGTTSRASPIAQMVRGEFPDDLFSNEQASQLRDLFGFDSIA